MSVSGWLSRPSRATSARMSRSSKTMLRSRFHPAIPVTSSYFYLVHDRARSYRNGGYESSLNTRGNISPSFCRCLGATSRGDCATPRKTHGNRHKLRRKPGIRNPREKGARCAKKKNRWRCVPPLLCVAPLYLVCHCHNRRENKIHGYVRNTLQLSTLWRLGTLVRKFRQRSAVLLSFTKNLQWDFLPCRKETISNYVNL